MTDTRGQSAERVLAPNDIIVSKTDLQGRITYANNVFLTISDLTEDTALGQPHNIIRHPDMPAGVYQYMWDTIQAGQEIFAYVKNRATTGDYYWVYAYVTPSYDTRGTHIGYHSSRRAVTRDAITRVEQVYTAMKNAEHGLTGRARAHASLDVLTTTLERTGHTYSQWVWSLTHGDTP